jgi:hypothetical protein
MIQATTIYYDTDEMATKEALYAACDAIKHRPQERGAFTHDSLLPNGKQLIVDSNESMTQVRIATVPVN